MNVKKVRAFVASDFDFDGSYETEDGFVFGVLGQNLGADIADFCFVGKEEPFVFGVRSSLRLSRIGEAG